MVIWLRCSFSGENRDQEKAQESEDDDLMVVDEEEDPQEGSSSKRRKLNPIDEDNDLCIIDS